MDSSDLTHLFTAPAPPHRPGELALLRVSRRAMATTFEIALPTAGAASLAAAEAALDLVDDLEELLTVYRDSSEVSRLNRIAPRGWAETEPRVFDLLAESARLSLFTGGTFDIAAGAMVRAWADAKREGRIPTPPQLAEARRNSGMRHVQLDAAARRVRFRKPGLSLNFGAVGKGYALDRAADLLRREFGVASALLQAGGSSVRALGAPPGQAGWLVTICHPHRPDESIGDVLLVNESLGTSAATYQSFQFGGKTYGHVLDPRTALPVSGVASASVTAPTAAEADALSTAAFVQGLPLLHRWADQRPDCRGVVLMAGADVPETWNFARGRFRPAARRLQWPQPGV